jgi:hypothetical protein
MGAGTATEAIVLLVVRGEGREQITEEILTPEFIIRNQP